MKRFIKRSIRLAGQRAGLFFSPSPDDVFLISFPRSGNSWLRQAIAEMMFGESGEQYNDIHTYVPTVDMTMPVWRLKGSRFHVVKSHENRMLNHRTDGYRRVIYVVRDPRDVVLSHFRFVKQLGIYPGELDDFLPDWTAGRIWPGSWSTHVASWALNRDSVFGENMLLVSYEELSADPKKIYRRVAEFLGLDLSEATLDRVLKQTSIKSMQSKERRTEHKIKGFRSVNKGGVNKWKGHLRPDQVKMVQDCFGHIMDHFGYGPART